MLTTLVAASALATAGTTARAEIRLTTALPSEIQNAINTKCPEAAPSGTAVGCHIILPCGEWLADDGYGNPSSIKIWIRDKQNVRISGCGMNGTTIRWTPASSTVGWLLLINTTSAGATRWITIEDLKLEVDCPGGCAAGMNIAQVYGGVQDVAFERVHFHAKDSGTGTAINPWPSGLVVGGASGGVTATASRIHAYSSNFHATGYGLSFANCNDCWVSDSWFGPMTDVARPSYALANKQDGWGVRFTNNTFDLGGDVSVGLYLRSDNPSNAVPGQTAQVSDNSFVNIQDSVTGSGGPGTAKQYAINVYKYSRANISHNLFSCPSTDPGCTGYGVGFLSFGSGCPTGTASCNDENLIAGNVFDRIVDDGTVAQCAIPVRTFTNGNKKNVIASNVFKLGSGSAANANGICGENESDQIPYDNTTFAP